MRPLAALLAVALLSPVLGSASRADVGRLQDIDRQLEAGKITKEDHRRLWQQEYESLMAGLKEPKAPTLPAAKKERYVHVFLLNAIEIDGDGDSEWGGGVTAGQLFGPKEEFDLGISWGHVDFSGTTRMPYLVHGYYRFEPMRNLFIGFGPLAGVTNSVRGSHSDWDFSYGAGATCSTQLGNSGIELTTGYKYVNVARSGGDSDAHVFFWGLGVRF